MKINDRLTYQLARAEHAMRHVLEHSLRQHGISLTSWAVLSHIANSPGLSIAEITRRTFITQQAVSKIAAQLERGGLVHRAKRKGNQRIQDLVATANGTSLSATCDELVVGLERKLRAELGQERILQLTQAMCAIETFFGVVHDV